MILIVFLIYVNMNGLNNANRLFERIINIINNFWYCRNHAQFNDKRIKLQTIVNHICTSVAITGNDIRASNIMKCVLK